MSGLGKALFLAGGIAAVVYAGRSGPQEPVQNLTIAQQVYQLDPDSQYNIYARGLERQSRQRQFQTIDRLLHTIVSDSSHLTDYDKYRIETMANQLGNIVILLTRKPLPIAPSDTVTLHGRE